MKIAYAKWFVLFILFVTAFNLNCLTAQSNSNSTTSTKTSKKDKKFRIGFSSEMFSGVNMRDAIAAIDMYATNLVADLNKKNDWNYKVSTYIYYNRNDLIKVVKNNDCDLIALTCREYIDLKDDYDLIPALMNVEDIRDDSYVLLINNGKGIKSLNDLKGKKILVSADGRGDMGLLWLGTLLMQGGLEDCADFFGEIKRVDKQSQAILPVFFGQYDACITISNSFDEIIKLNPQIGNKLSVFKKTKKLAYGMMCFIPSLSSDERKAVVQTAKSLQDYPSGRQVLKLFQLPFVTDFNQEIFDNVEYYIKTYQKLKSEQGKNQKSKKK